MADMTDAELLAALGVEAEPKKKVARSPREERIIAGFEEIQRFVEEHGHAPQHGEDRDIFERIYATRLDQIRRQKECRELVSEFDHQGLLGTETVELEGDTESLDDEELQGEGELQNLKGKGQSLKGKAKEKLKDLVDRS